MGTNFYLRKQHVGKRHSHNRWTFAGSAKRMSSYDWFQYLESFPPRYTDHFRQRYRGGYHYDRRTGFVHQRGGTLFSRDKSGHPGFCPRPLLVGCLGVQILSGGMVLITAQPIAMVVQPIQPKLTGIDDLLFDNRC